MIVPVPEPGDYLVRSVGGIGGIGISVGQFLNGEHLTVHRHAEVYVGAADVYGPYGYTVSAYPDRRGRRALDRPAQDMEGVWSSGVIELTFEQRRGIVEWCLENQHVPYSWLDYGALTLHRLGVDDPALKRYIADSGHMICSQYTDLAFRENGVHLFSDGRWPGYVTPEMLAELVTGLCGPQRDSEWRRRGRRECCGRWRTPPGCWTSPRAT